MDAHCKIIQHLSHAKTTFVLHHHLSSNTARMSFTPLESVRLLKKAEIERQRRLDKEIDVDVQKLREMADDHMLRGRIDGKGYYVLSIQRASIKYKKTQGGD